jgi:hypothetical protein
MIQEVYHSTPCLLSDFRVSARLRYKQDDFSSSIPSNLGEFPVEHGAMSFSFFYSYYPILFRRQGNGVASEHITNFQVFAECRLVLPYDPYDLFFRQ